MRIDDFDYELPERLIAQNPLQIRGGSKLLVANPKSLSISDTQFNKFIDYILPNDLIILIIQKC